MISPDTIIHLLNIPLDEDQKNQIVFNNTSDQYTYMYNKKLFTYTEFTYQRKDNVVRVGTHIDNLWNCNYVMYKNKQFSDKWFYAFIVKKEYSNESVTNLYLKTDVWQTWFSEITLKNSFIEREHVTDDTIGIHTIPENLETGEYTIDGETDLDFLGDFIPCMAVTGVPTGVISIGIPPEYNEYGGVFSGNLYLIARDNEGMSNLLKCYADQGKTDAIVSIFMIPEVLASDVNWITVNGWGWSVEYGVITGSGSYSFTALTTIEKPTTLNTYTPKNNKLLTFPYCYINLDNNVGNCVTYNYELFSGENCNFAVDMVITPSCSIKVSPSYYKGLDINYHHSIMVGKLPICSFPNDVYTNWLTQNGLNVGINTASSLLQIVGGVGLLATGVGATAGASTILSGALGIGSTLGQIYQHSLIPPSLEGNLGGADVVFTAGLSNPRAYKISIRREYAEIIDNYFTMFGYKVNTVKTPNIKTRPYYNYIKTIDCNITGTAPQEDIIAIKNMFDKGCTFWKNGDNIGDYSLDNSIVE